MQTTISKAALASGLLVFAIILILLFSGAGSFILLAIYGAPGLIYGLALTAPAHNRVSAFRSISFVLLSMTINIVCVYYVSNDFLDYSHYAPLKLVACSTIGAVLFTSGYALVILRRFSAFRTIAMPSILGIVASLFSALFMHLLISNKYNEFVSSILWVGMVAIFPLWQYLIGLNLDY
jgi:hypothetical protein